MPGVAAKVRGEEAEGAARMSLCGAGGEHQAESPVHVLVKSVTIAYRETEVQSVTSLIQLPRRRPRVPPSPQGVGSSFPFDAPADHKLKYSQLHRVLPCEAKSSLRVTVVLMRSCFSSWT